jgi:hypothetical protein
MILTIAELRWVLVFMGLGNYKPIHTAQAIKTWATGLYFSPIADGFA